jgi:hypothetical protein
MGVKTFCRSFDKLVYTAFGVAGTVTLLLTPVNHPEAL